MPRSESATRPSRRGLLALGGAAAGLVVVGCDSDSSQTPVGPTPSTSASNDVEPDVATAVGALGAITAVREAIEATRDRFPAAGAPLARLVALHLAHEKRLADAVPDDVRTQEAPPAFAVPARRAEVLPTVQAAEGRLLATLNGQAVRAQSGAFARLLASMGAGIAQHLQVPELQAGGR